MRMSDVVMKEEGSDTLSVKVIGLFSFVRLSYSPLFLQ